MRPEMQGAVTAPGRVNLIGEHIDYHGLPVLPIALRRAVRVKFRRRDDQIIRATSEGFGTREFEWTAGLLPVAAGDWENYLRAAGEVVSGRWGAAQGIDAEVTSDLPPAAGLSSSSALMISFALALLEANGIRAGFEELMELFPEGEQFVGTRGGAMDHAAILGSRAGCASLIEFGPLRLRPISIPQDWAFLVADSGVRAEKSGTARQEFNARRTAGSAALAKLGVASFLEQVPSPGVPLSNQESDAYLHVTSEAARVRDAVCALERQDASAFGRLLLESHASLRDGLKVSHPALDRLVEDSIAAGALGARLTGAGFGGCAVLFCLRRDVPAVRRRLEERYPLIDAEAGPGVLEN
ncbi:MAG TPA: galactokinase family protein [Bryobacteraceae bacterium]